MLQKQWRQEQGQLLRLAIEINCQSVVCNGGKLERGKRKEGAGGRRKRREVGVREGVVEEGRRSRKSCRRKSL